MIDQLEDLVPGVELTNKLGGYSQAYVDDSSDRFIYVDDFVRTYLYTALQLCVKYRMLTWGSNFILYLLNSLF